MATKARQAVAGKANVGGRGGGGKGAQKSAANERVTGAMNRSVAAISPKGQVKKIQGGNKQNPGRSVPKTPAATQGQRGKNGPATKSGQRKNTSAHGGY